jgi:hypothetical protein
MQWLPEDLPAEAKRLGRDSDSHLHLLLRWGISGAIPLLSLCTSSWRIFTSILLRQTTALTQFLQTFRCVTDTPLTLQQTVATSRASVKVQARRAHILKDVRLERKQKVQCYTEQAVAFIHGLLNNSNKKWRQWFHFLTIKMYFLWTNARISWMGGSFIRSYKVNFIYTSYHTLHSH